MCRESSPQTLSANRLQSSGPNQEIVLDQKQRRSALAEAMENLAERQRKILEMYYQQELSMREIAALLGIHESRVSQIHLAAITRLRKSLSQKDSAAARVNRMMSGAGAPYSSRAAVA